MSRTASLAASSLAPTLLSKYKPEPRVAQLGYTAHVSVQVAGKQRADGTLDRWIEIDARGLLTAQDVQKMCYNALAAADELAALAIDDAPSGTGPA